MSDPFAIHYDEPLTPVQTESKLRSLVTELTLAQGVLRDARDAEVDAVHEFKAAHRAAMLSADCPKVSRGGVTTGERDAWVDERCAAEEFARDIATATREAAQDHLRVVRDQASIVQSLGVSVRLAYQMAGAS